MPLHWRRAYFMASLARHLSNGNIPDEVLAKNVSAALNHLVTPRGLIYFLNKRSIWKDLPTIEKAGPFITQQEIDKINQGALSIIPGWMWYAPERSMRRDCQLAIHAAVNSNNNASLNRKIEQSYGKYVEKPKKRSVFAQFLLGKNRP